MIDETELQAIESRCNAATPGPWFQDNMGPWKVRDAPTGDRVATCDKDTRAGREDAAFIAASREDIPKLLAALRESLLLNETAKMFMAKQDESIVSHKVITAWQTERDALRASLTESQRHHANVLVANADLRAEVERLRGELRLGNEYAVKLTAQLAEAREMLQAAPKYMVGNGMGLAEDITAWLEANK